MIDAERALYWPHVAECTHYRGRLAAVREYQYLLGLAS